MFSGGGKVGVGGLNYTVNVDIFAQLNFRASSPW